MLLLRLENALAHAPCSLICAPSLPPRPHHRRRAATLRSLMCGTALWPVRALSSMP